MTVGIGADMSLKNKLLVAALEYERTQGGGPDADLPYTLEQLAVKAWEMWPGTFGMHGFKDRHPDPNRVAYSVMGKGNLVHDGLLRKCGKKMYRLSNMGRKWAEALAAGEQPPPLAAKAVAKPEKPVAATSYGLGGRLVTSEAVVKFASNMTALVTATDAFSFWGITSGMRDDYLQKRIVALTANLRQLRSLAEDQGKVEDSGQTLTAAECCLLVNVHSWLMERFARHLKALGYKPAG